MHVDDHLAGQDYLLGDSFCVADAYAFTILSWAPVVGIDLSRWPTWRPMSHGSPLVRTSAPHWRPRIARHGGRMTMQLIDKVAIVTGAGSGIGKEIARHFANEGAKVAIADINLDAARGAAAEIDPPAS